MHRRAGLPAALIIAGLLAAPLTGAQSADAQRDAARERARERREERERERELERRRAEREARSAARRNQGGSPSTGGRASTVATNTGGAPRLRPATNGGTTSTGGRPNTGGTAGARTTTNPTPVTPVVVPDNIEELRTTRPERRKASVGALRSRWGGLVGQDPAKEELKKHAKRVAFLQRIRTLAAAKADQKLVQSVDQLLTTEETRHSDAMNKLRTGAP